jgi:hypothetical protein
MQDAAHAISSRCARSRSISFRESRPPRCDPGTTCNAPACGGHGSRCTLTATNWASTSGGCCVYSTPSFNAQPVHRDASIRSRTGTLRSWCGATAQFFSALFSNSVHCTATASGGSKEAVAGCTLNDVTNCRHHGSASRLRLPAVARPSCATCQSASSQCAGEIAPETIAYPNSEKCALFIVMLQPA